MAYSTNPNLAKARALAMKLLVLEQQAVQVVANRCGIHRSTVWRWKCRWLKLNEHVQLSNYNRPNRAAGTVFRPAALCWSVPTLSSRPHTSPRAIVATVVQWVLELRATLKRCAEVIWHHITHEEGIPISLSSVRRILQRHHETNGRRKRVRPDNPKRPLPTKPGELVQTDTIHCICPFTKRQRYVYTVIDLYSRMAYAVVASRVLPGLAARAVLEAQASFGFQFAMVQADNGPEFGRYFEQVLTKANVRTRHSRLGRPNDNAHIERFNRTIQEECLGSYLGYRTTDKTVQERLTAYLDYYNFRRVHLGLQCRVPAVMLQRS